MIRKAKVEDAKDIANLIVRSWQTSYRGLISQTYLDNMQENDLCDRWSKNISNQNNNIYVYEKTNKILGVINFGKVMDREDKIHNAEILVLYVEPNLKRQGIGTKMFNYAKEYFVDNNAKNLIIWCLKGNMSAISFYKNMGGKIISERKSKVNNLEVEEVGIEYKLSDEIKLIRPTKEYEEQAIEYKKEHFENGEKSISASSKWDKIDNYADWLKFLNDHSRKETIHDNWTVATEFFGVRQKDNKIVGMINIRHELTTDFLRNYAGHIGYGVRPSERKKGYVTEMLKQALTYCKEELNLEKVMISCDRENEGSRKTILNAGGILEREYKAENGENVQIYWIKLK